MKRNIFPAAMVCLLCQPALADSMSTIEQIGSGHVAEVRQSGGSSEILQDGSNHSAVLVVGGTAGSIIRQIGEGNQADISSGGGGGTPFGFGAATVVHQEGSGNAVIVNQVAGNSAGSAIRQFGTGNSAEIFQQGTFSTGDSDLTQSGAGNTAYVEQVGFFGAHRSAIDVLGDGNHTEVVQGRNIAGDGSGNVSDMVIAGNDNEVLVSQDTRESRNTSMISTVGDGNVISLDQNALRGAFDGLSTRNDSIIDVNGTMNTVTLLQENLTSEDGISAGANDSEIRVDGISNQISVEQASRSGGPSKFNSSLVTTTGSGNTVNVTQQ